MIDYLSGWMVLPDAPEEYLKKDDSIVVGAIGSAGRLLNRGICP